MRSHFIAAIALLCTTGCAYEQPSYEPAGRTLDFEVRRYAERLVAEVEVEGDFDAVGNEAFRILVAFIGGDNRAQQEIAMTTPVTQQPARSGEEIAMTGPVVQTAAGEDRYRFHFIMPAQYTRETLPMPIDPRITIRSLPPALVAVRRYSGLWREQRFRFQEDALRAALAKSGYAVTGPSVYARYDPPFTPWFLRRNEVWIPVEPPGGAIDPI